MRFIDMEMITDTKIKREALAMQLVYNFNLYDFTELCGKFEFEAGYGKEDAERLALECIRSIGRK